MEVRNGQEVDLIGWGVRNKPLVLRGQGYDPSEKRQIGKSTISINNITNGDSGGPVLNQEGVVIAIIAGGIIQGPKISAIPINYFYPLRIYALAYNDKERVDTIEKNVGIFDKMLEHLKQNVKISTHWSMPANIDPSVPKSIWLIIDFTKDFEEQYLPKALK
ncbi:MAG: hypothetical protein ACLQBC_08655, partial [Syntrophales bacterium]